MSIDFILLSLPSSSSVLFDFSGITGILPSWGPCGLFSNMPACLSGFLILVTFLAPLFLSPGFYSCSVTSYSTYSLQGIPDLENAFFSPFNSAMHVSPLWSSVNPRVIPHQRISLMLSGFCMFLVGFSVPPSHHCPLPHHLYLPGAYQHPSHPAFYLGSPQIPPGGPDSQVCAHPETIPQIPLHDPSLTSLPTFHTPETFH